MNRNKTSGVRALRIVIGITVIALMMADRSGAATEVSGPITSDTTWTLSNSPYIVVGDVLVNNGIILTIEPGVLMKFNSSNLQINGTLIARGTSSDPIVFTSNKTTPVTGDWGYIFFGDSSTDATYDADGNYIGGSILEYCIVEYAGGMSVSDNGAVRMNNAHPFINYCTIRNNKASGIKAWDVTGLIKITNSTISKNIASDSGGGIYVSGGTATIYNNTIINNTAGRAVSFGGGGGGIAVINSITTISNNVLINNSALGGTYYYYGGSDGGGGVYVSGGTATISNNTIDNNMASLGGGGIYVFSGAQATIFNNSISRNTATAQYGSGNSGGGIGIHSATVTISNNNITNNIISGDGGGISVYGSTVTISNNTISNNKLSSGGFSYGGGGGIIVFFSSAATIFNNFISENKALYRKYDGTPHVGGGIYTYYATAIISNNSIVRNSALNASAVYYSSGDELDFKHNTISGNKATGSSPTATVFVSSHPLFNYNNIFGNSATYELWNDNAQGSVNVNAKNNWWGTTNDSAIQAKIYDGLINPSKGVVDYSPYLFAPDTIAPISPPQGLTTTELRMTETSSRIHTLFETIFSRNATLTTSVKGDLNGTLNFTDSEFVFINSGSFAGKGFSKGNWVTNIEGYPYDGYWQGMLFKKPDERKIYLKGVVSGGLQGIVEGYLTESVNGSDVYDQYKATWTISQIGADIVFAKLDIDGTVNYQNGAEYSSELYALQTSIEGKAIGYYNGSLSVVLTHVRIDNNTNPYYGQGFSIISYISEYGSGEGWTYDKLVSPGRVEMKGLFTSPLMGIVSAMLDESKTPRSLSVTIERIDIGLPPAPDLKVKVWGPERVSPGQIVNYIIEYRNDGIKAAEDLGIIVVTPEFLEYISSSEGGFYCPPRSPGINFWPVSSISPKELGYKALTVRIPIGIPVLTQISVFAYIAQGLKKPPKCGDGFCDSIAGENFFTCPEDCPPDIERPDPPECEDCPEDTSNSTVAVARDPNMKYGYEGFVLPGQKLNYTVEFENEGEGIAFGVYFTDTLDEDLDDSTLEIGPVISTIDGSIIAPAGTYNPSTRTITWLVGEVGPGAGGYANISVNVRSDAEEGTEIINYATVYFPSVPETTRTNGVVSVVDVAPPRYSNVNQNKSVVTSGETNEIYAYWQDGVQLNYTWLETNESGTWQDTSYLKLSGDEAWSNFTIQSTKEGAACWRIHANDTAGNENVTPTLCFGVQPGTTIQVNNPSANPIIILNDNGRGRPLGANITRLNVTVMGNISSVTIDLSPIGGSAKAPMTNIPDTDIYTITTNATAGINLVNNLVMNATDTRGNFNNSVSIPLTVLLRGDIVRDNKIDLKDLLYLRRYLAGLEPSINPLVADIQTAEGDGNVDLKDLLYLRRYLANLELLI